jgi:hypothetical protein
VLWAERLFHVSKIVLKKIPGRICTQGFTYVVGE